MKTRHYIIILCITVFSTSHHAIAQKKSQDQIIGSWTFDYSTALVNIEDASRTLLNKMPLAKRQNIEKLYKDRVITFDSNGTYTLTLADGRSITRQWNVRGNQLTIRTDEEYSEVLIIKKMKDNTLVLKPKAKGKAKPLISEWHFTKN